MCHRWPRDEANEQGRLKMGLFANYDIEEVIAEGDLATVYKCSTANSESPLAVKVLSQQLLTLDPGIIDRFTRESPVLSRLNHPNVVHYVDLGISGGLPYLVMPYHDGGSLKTMLAQGKLELRRKLDIALQICKALAYAHKNGIVHGGFKPANVLIGQHDSVVVTDFCFTQLVGSMRDEQGPIAGRRYLHRRGCIFPRRSVARTFHGTIAGTTAGSSLLY
jgi:serine/threonine protein kinase